MCNNNRVGVVDFPAIAINIREIHERGEMRVVNYSASFKFLLDRELFVRVDIPQPEGLNPRAMCYRSTALFRLDNIGRKGL